MLQIFAIVVSLAIAAVGITLFVRAIRDMLRVIRMGQPAMNRTDQPGKRTWVLVRETLGHTRMLQWKLVGAAHWFIFVGFGLLFFTLLTAFGQLFDAHFLLPLIGEFFLYEWVTEFFTVVMIAAIVGFIIYRATRPKERTRGVKGRFWGSTMWQGYFVESVILGVGLCIVILRGLEYALLEAEGSDHANAFHFPLTAWLGELFSGLSVGTIENLVYLMAMLKILISFTWMIVISRNIDMGVAWHRFTVFFNIFFKREASGATALGAVKPLTNEGKRVSLDDIDDLDEDATLGVGTIEDFSWKGILDFTTCTECGRCQSQCPAWNTEKPLSPKLLITALRDHAYQKAPYVQAGGEGSETATALLEKDETLAREAERPLVGDTGDDWFYMPDSGAAVIDSEVLWNCTSCGACVQQCPVDIEHVDHIIDMRRYQVLVESNFPAELNGLFKGLENKGNPWNMSPSARMDWAKGLDFDVKVVGEDIESLEEVDWLFWVGCAGAYEDRQKKTTRAVAELLDMAGVSFGVLGNGETCSGDPARRAGNEFVFQGLAQQNVETFQEYKVKKAVTTCAHCFNTLKNEYKEFGIELEVVHHTQLLNRLVREGKLTPVKTGEGAHKRSITYHDPCYIGRHNGVYSPPRELLQVLPGAEYVEMERNSERSFCCGAGGARMWMEENTGERINVNRTKEAVGTGADQIAVGCPFCRVMLSDGLTAEQSKGEAREEVEVLDVAQMLLASVKGEVATKIKPGGGTPSAKAAPSEEVKAEPEPGDATQASSETVTETEDAGPLAKASGGSSLFDTPAPDAASGDQAESASTGSSVQEEAEAGASAGGGSGSGGSSLFDLGADDGAADEPAPTASTGATKAEPAAGGSLFDIGGDEPAEAPAAKAQPKAQPKTEPKTEPKSEEPAGKADLGSGGSLFDISADEPAPAPEASQPKAEEPAAKAEAQEAPEAPAGPAPEMNETDLSSGGSLFDIEAPAEAPAAPAAAAPAEEVVEAETEPAAPAAAAPSASIPEGGSLFDIAAPEAVATPERQPEAPAEDSGQAPASEDPAEERSATAPTSGLSGGAAVSAAATAAASADPAPDAEPQDEAPSEAEPQDEELAEEKPKASSNGEANQPKTDVEISEGGSLFDL
ncbi:(Fe-S)-binding protein [Nocardioides sp. SYSU DS0663]|uniref:(Fe-S)-binding protein n=1 Tax=Nocardioides sp. SYSU DS0663 TaxID=3416445 RepID=UPI003F4B11D2